MLIVGGIIGALLSLFAIAGPTSISMAGALGTVIILPISAAFTVAWEIGLLIQFAVTLLLYIIAALATAPVQGRVTTNGVEQFCRGMLIGINAIANGLYFFVLVTAALVATFSPFVALVLPFAIVLAAINFLCVFEGLTTSFSFEAVLGWTAWLLPMNWPLQILGALMFAFCSALNLFGMSFAGLGAWWPGMVARHGFPFSFNGAFTLGNFSFVSPSILRTSPHFVGGQASPDTALGVISHEVGHALTSAAFGFFFGFILWVHERIWSFFNLGGGKTYGEMLTESIRRTSGSTSLPVPDSNPWIPMWAPPVILSGPDGGNAIPVAVILADGGVVDASSLVSAAVGVAVNLDASGSSDGDAYPMGNVSPGGTPALGFAWELSTVPTGSTATIASPTLATTTFTPDVAGDYVVAVIVSDGSEADTFSFRVFV